MGYHSLVQRITYKVSGRASATSGLYIPSNAIYDYALAGVPFMSATGDTRPDTEKPVPQRKDQFDSYKDPGEYSLNQWWLRSQTSFIGGAGVVFQDPDSQGTTKNIRFAQSLGIDPFTDQDNLLLLKETEQATAIGGANTGFAYVTPQVNSLGDMVYVARGSTIESRLVTASNLTISSTATIPSGAATQGIVGGIAAFQDGSVAVPTAFVMAFMSDTVTPANSGIYSVAAGGAVATKIYTAPAVYTNITLAKARGLVCLGAQNSFYALDPYAAAATPLPVANAVVPKDQTIVAITDGPDAIYVAANSKTQGYIYKTTFSNTGVVNGLTLTAVLPAGELVNDCQAYISTYLVISSNTGIRVGSFGASASSTGVTYGPQIVTVPITGTSTGVTGSGFGRITFFGSKAYVCTLGTPQHQGLRGLMAIELGVIIGDQNTGAQFNPYSTWNYFADNTDSLQDVCVTQKGRPVFTTGSGGSARLFIEHETNYIANGFLDTGRCRFNTVEPKLFKYFSIRVTSPLLAEITISVLDDTGGVTPYITYGPTLDPGTNDIATPTPSGPRNWEALRFTLRRGVSDATITPKLDSWQIKSLPGTLKQRMITRQFLCFNDEKDRSGQRVSGDTQALDKLTAIRQACQRGDTVTFQDLTQNISTQVIIDDYQFVMMSPPGPNMENYGGYLTVVMRTVADAVPDNATQIPEAD